MTKLKPEDQIYEVFPLTPNRWQDFETLFGPNVGCAGCWCTWWLLTNKEFSSINGVERKETLRTLVQQGKEPGLLAYLNGIPAGWVAVAPRTDYLRLNNSKKFAEVDDQPVWLISCFFINRKYRKQGLMEKLTAAACEFARSKGVPLIEAFPKRAAAKASPLSIYTGVDSVFLRQGFVVVAEREDRPIMRKTL